MPVEVIYFYDREMCLYLHIFNLFVQVDITMQNVLVERTVGSCIKMCFLLSGTRTLMYWVVYVLYMALCVLLRLV